MGKLAQEIERQKEEAARELIQRKHLHEAGIHDAVLIPQASGKHLPLLKLTHEHHMKYAESMYMDYRCIFGRTVPADKANWPAQWEKMFLIQFALKTQYKYIFWIDADAVIVDMSMDFRQVMKKAIMMTKHPGGYFDPSGKSWHYNDGVLFVKNDPIVSKLIDMTIDLGPGGPGWYDQLVLNYLVAIPFFYRENVGELDVKYNSCYGVNTSPSPVINTIHGPHAIEKKLEVMREWMKGF